MRRIAGAAILVSLLGLLAAPAGAAGAPEAHLGSSNVALGDRVLVQGSGWPAGSLVLLQLCGNGAIDTSADCALTTGINAGVGADGTFSMLLNVERPPTACPCVVWVTDSTSTADAKVPIQVVGLPSEVLRQRT